MSIIQCNNTGKPEGVEEWRSNRPAREDLTLALVCGCRNMDFIACKIQPGAPAFNKKYYWQVVYIRPANMSVMTLIKAV